MVSPVANRPRVRGRLRGAGCGWSLLAGSGCLATTRHDHKQGDADRGHGDVGANAEDEAGGRDEVLVINEVYRYVCAII